MKKIYYLCSTCIVTFAFAANANAFSINDLPLSDASLKLSSSHITSSGIKLAKPEGIGGNNVLQHGSTNGTTTVKTFGNNETCEKEGDIYIKAYGNCFPECTEQKYPRTSEPDSNKGSFRKCMYKDLWTNYESCYASNGYVWNANQTDCVPNTCEGYPYNEKPASLAGTVDETPCITPNGHKYRYTSCNEGWSSDTGAGRCDPKNCSLDDYPYSESQKDKCKQDSFNQCKSGAATRIGCTDCNEGYHLDRGYCTSNTCDPNVYPYATENEAAGCGEKVSCKAGDNALVFGCSLGVDCASGYSRDPINPAKCVANTCDGFTSASSTIDNCASTASCTKPEGTVYKCAQCTSDYKSDGNGGCEPKETCTQGVTSQIENCADEPICTDLQGQPHYAKTCSTCNAGYALRNDQCVTQVPTCNVGDIYYANNTCSANKISGQTPIGIVYDNVYKLVISLTEETKAWNDRSSTYYDIPELTNYPNDAQEDMSGKSNTDIIIAYGQSIKRTHQAAQYCYEMRTNASLGNKEWYLPSLGEWARIARELGSELNKVEKVNTAIKKVGGTIIDADHTEYWSSSEVNNQKAWRATPETGGSLGMRANSPKHETKNDTGTKPVKARCIFSYAEDYCQSQGYSLTECPKNARCSVCGGHYKIKNCEAGYTLNNGTCVDSGHHPTCNIGDIYYADDTCDANLVSGKTAIGIVYDNANKLVMALTEGTNLAWNDGETDCIISKENCNDCPCLCGKYAGCHYTVLGKATNRNIDMYAMDGWDNTDLIVESARSIGMANPRGKKHQAAEYCHDMTTGGKAWFLPSRGEIRSNIKNSLTIINTALRKAKGTTIDTGYTSSNVYWTSFEDATPQTHGAANAVAFRYVDTSWVTGGKTGEIKVRCIFRYDRPDCSSYPLTTFVDDGTQYDACYDGTGMHYKEL